MRKTTKKIVTSFLARTSAAESNTRTDGQSLLLHGNKIAEHRADGIYVTYAGWQTKVTKERLNGILSAMGVGRIVQKDFTWYLNGQKWNGAWTKVSGLQEFA